MISRRGVIGGVAAAVAAPFISSPRTAWGTPLAAGLDAEYASLVRLLGLDPYGRADGERDHATPGGVVSALTVRGQAEMMAPAGFTQTPTGAADALRSDGVGYIFARVSANGRNICAPMGGVREQTQGAYGGAYTLLEGPNLVGLRVLAAMLADRGVSQREIMDLVWPVRSSATGGARERALLFFDRVVAVQGADGLFHDRDVLHARSAQTVLRYAHRDGTPTGDGEGAVIQNGAVVFQYRFTFDRATLRS